MLFFKNSSRYEIQYVGRYLVFKYEYKMYLNVMIFYKIILIYKLYYYQKEELYLHFMKQVMRGGRVY